ncbi:MAG: MFS transporter [Acidobacteria bacterium]|nr:MFS transporter [Acidobacteriota bacterium]
MTDATVKPATFYGWKVLSVTAVMYFAMTGLLLYSFPVFLPFLCDAFGWSRAAVSWANSLAMVVAGIASPLAGLCIAKYGARLVIVIGAILSILCFVFVSFHTRLWELYFAYGALLGTGCCFCGMIAMTTIANNWFVKRRSLALSILLTAGGLGGLVMVSFIMALINRFGWRHAYLVIAGFVLVLLVILPALLVKNKPEDVGQIPDGVYNQDKKAAEPSARILYTTPVDFTAAEAVRTPAFWFLTIFGTCYLVGLQGFMLHQVAFLRDIKVSDAMAAAAYSTFVGISAVGRLGLGFLGLKYSIRHLAVIATILMISGLTLFLWADTLPMVFICNCMVGIGMGATYVAFMSILPLYFGKTHYPKIIGYSMPFLTIIGALGSPATGWIRDVTGSYMLAWKLAILVLIIGLISILLARAPIHPSLKKDPAAVIAA